MGTNSNTMVRLAPNGTLWVGPYGTPMPTVATFGVNAAFVDSGYLSEDGVTVTPKVDIKDINAWQAAVPVKTLINTVGLEIKGTLKQFNRNSTSLYFFDSTWTTAGGNATMNVSSNPALTPHAVIVEWTDDSSYAYRLCVPNCIVTDRDAVDLKRTESVDFGFTLRALDNAGTLATLLTTNPNVTSNS